MTRNEIKFLILRSIGNFLFLFAIFGVVATFGPAAYYEVQFRIIQARGVRFEVAEAPRGSNTSRQRVSFADLLVGTKEQVLVPIDTEFSILIPKLGASAKVIPNVDPSSEEKFLPALAEGVAHAQGTVFPGLSGNIYLFAHSADNFWNAGRYNAIFYLLKDLKEGDEIVIFFQGKRHNYFVTESRVVEPSDVSFITHALEGNEQLILQTCWPPGTTLKRFLVFARPRKTDVIFRN
ncbi:MAG: sortase [Candidatus Levybacteria bacterium]|nr:sortase [Candidatus Levybacteria bacterium]